MESEVPEVSLQVSTYNDRSSVSITYTDRELHLPAGDARRLRDMLCQVFPPEPRRITEAEAREVSGDIGKPRAMWWYTEDGAAWPTFTVARNDTDGEIIGYKLTPAYVVGAVPEPITLRDRAPLERLLDLMERDSGSYAVKQAARAVKEAMRDE